MKTRKTGTGELNNQRHDADFEYEQNVKSKI